MCKRRAAGGPDLVRKLKAVHIVIFFRISANVQDMSDHVRIGEAQMERSTLSVVLLVQGI